MSDHKIFFFHARLIVLFLFCLSCYFTSLVALFDERFLLPPPFLFLRTLVTVFFVDFFPRLC